MFVFILLNDMEDLEKIEVYIKLNKGKTECMCPVKNKKCSRECERDVVFRDRYFEWEKTMNGRY